MVIQHRSSKERANVDGRQSTLTADGVGGHRFRRPSLYRPSLWLVCRGLAFTIVTQEIHSQTDRATLLVN